MRESTWRWLPVVTGMVLSLGIAACSDQSRTNAAGEGEPRIALEEGDEQEPAESGGERARSDGEGEDGEGREGSEHGEGGESGEHDEGREGSEHGEGGEGEGEESGVYIGSDETWDAVRNGARLVLAFDSGSGAFVGRVENTTGRTLCAVRVEVHLSTGTELGPTARTDLPAGEETAVELAAGGEEFATWTAHPEISRCTGD